MIRVLWLLLTLGCASTTPSSCHILMPDELKDDVNYILQEGKRRGVYINQGPGMIQYEASELYAGACYRMGLFPVDTPWIVDLAPELRDAPPICWRSLVWHELGHCLLGLPHKVTPGHIMSMGFWDQCEYYMDNDVTWDTLERDFWEFAETIRRKPDADLPLAQ